MGSRYSDVLHEVAPLTKGHRVALIYNLCVSGARWDLSAAKMVSNPKLLSCLTSIRGSQSSVAFALSNKYSISQIPGGFKGYDHFVISHLVQGIEKVGALALYAGELTVNTRSRECEECEYRDPSESRRFFGQSEDLWCCDHHMDYGVDNLVHVAGKRISPSSARRMQVYDDLLGLGCTLEGFSPEKEKEEDTGNEGVEYVRRK